MPSFTSLALSLLALSAQAFAGSVQPQAADAFADLAKRAPDAHHHHHHPARWCHHNYQCKSTVPLSKPFCNHGTCDFTCKGNTTKKNGKCVTNHKPKFCRYNANCATSVANATPACYENKCTFKCKSNFHQQGNTCVENEHLCGGKSCPHVGNGYAICKNNHWVPQCHFNLGYKLYHLNGQYQCVATASDPNNCGSLGKHCPPGYNGLGHPICTRGHCDLDCNGFKTRTSRSHHKYCSKA